VDCNLSCFLLRCPILARLRVSLSSNFALLCSGTTIRKLFAFSNFSIGLTLKKQMRQGRISKPPALIQGDTSLVSP